jgi:hypothetical protein
MEAVFERDAAHCRELDVQTWSHRGIFHRCRDNAAYLLKYQI